MTLKLVIWGNPGHMKSDELYGNVVLYIFAFVAKVLGDCKGRKRAFVN